jgi:hypothetical protein
MQSLRAHGTFVLKFGKKKKQEQKQKHNTVATLNIGPVNK